ncbi:MAG: type II secretion system GspH family protein [Methylococcaceae bacterium]|nr:type II secretion system GspH family protein [Methylococcaceae bacterium]
MHKQTFKKQIMKGFTLVELLIVVIILAILAAIVVPQFASTTDDAKLSALDTTLSNMRAAIDLYYQQHGEYPGDLIASGGICPSGGTAGGGAAGSAAAFTSQLSMYTDKDGLACSTTDPVTFKYGPYLKKSTLPNNPITDINTLVVATGGNLIMTVQAKKGWTYDTKTGKFIADDSTLDPTGVAYSEH